MMRLDASLWGAAAVWACVFAVNGSADAATMAVPAGGDLQAALNAAAPGDVITLAPGATYVGNFRLPVKPASGLYITVRSAAPDSALPAAGVRITPAYAAVLPKIRSDNTEPALQTVAGAHHWKLMFLEFPPTKDGYYDILTLGTGDSTQTQTSQVPYSIVVDRVYVHGDPLVGQKRGIALNSSDTTIVNSYISDIKAVGQDSQAISGYNGPGNYVIENNYLEAAAENVLFGGSDPYISNLVTSNITFRRNYLTKPLAWRNPLIAAPTGVTAVAASTGGALASGAYFYRVVARRPAGQGNLAKSDASTEVTATVPSGATGSVTITWTAVAGATEYRVYGRSAGAENQFWTTTGIAFTDTGTVGTSGTVGTATKWSVKNLFELKNAQDVLVEGNVMENCWVADQNGYAIVLTPRNQSGGAPWAVVQRVTVRNNLVRHAAGGVNILGTDDEHPSQLTNNITIRDNVFDDLGLAWGSGSRTFQAGAGGDAITFDHNTVDSTDTIVLSLYGGTPTAPVVLTRFTYTNNMSEHATYGIFASGMAPDLPSITAYLPGGVVTRNVLAGGTASKLPAGNYTPSVAAWQADFVDFNGADYRLRSTSVFRNAGTDGADLGANIATVTAYAANVLSGDTGTAMTNPTAPTGVQVRR
jgi:hypothetical protein